MLYSFFGYGSNSSVLPSSQSTLVWYMSAILQSVSGVMELIPFSYAA